MLLCSVLLPKPVVGKLISQKSQISTVQRFRFLLRAKLLYKNPVFRSRLKKQPDWKKMGGHGHAPGPLYEVPSPDVYKVEDVPELKKVQERLAAKGLKDPWLRNEVWRYTAFRGTPASRAFSGILRGARIGIPAFLITLGIEHIFGISYEPAHEHHEDHNDGHH